MRKIGIHLKNILIAIAQGIFKAMYVSSAQAKFAGACFEVQAIGVLRLQVAHNVGSAVRGVIVDDQQVKRVIERHHFSNYSLNVLPFVIGRYYDEGTRH